MSYYKRILALTDFSKDSLHAVSVAADFAKHFEGKLTVLHVTHDESQFNFVLTDKVYQSIRKDTDKEIKKNFEIMLDTIPKLKELGDNYSTTIRRGSPYAEGLLEIEKDNYDLVVIGSHGESGMKKFLYGSTSEKIAQRSHISVHITRPQY